MCDFSYRKRIICNSISRGSFPVQVLGGKLPVENGTTQATSSALVRFLVVVVHLVIFLSKFLVNNTSYLIAVTGLFFFFRTINNIIDQTLSIIIKCYSEVYIYSTLNQQFMFFFWIIMIDFNSFKYISKYSVD